MRRVLAVVVFVSGCTRAAPVTTGPLPTAPPPSAPLQSPAQLAASGNPSTRAAALFVEAGKVFLHPRCVNCHPADDRPRQRNGEIHEPPVARGPDDRGLPALECASCHQEQNTPLSRVPGAPTWHLAPKVMAWQGKTLGEICLQLKDPQRNGGKTLAQIVEHSAHDPLVGWGWHPGADREPAPGTQEQFGALMAAWVEAGAGCP